MILKPILSQDTLLQDSTPMQLVSGSVYSVGGGLYAISPSSSIPLPHASSHGISGSDPVSLSKVQVGLSNVDNTADNVKNVLFASTAGFAVPSGSAGGDLAGSYPNPTISPSILSVITASLLGKEPRHGFPVSSTGAYYVTLTYSAVTKKITLTPTGASFYFYVGGVLFAKTGAQVAGTAHSTTTGTKFFYYDNTGTLQTSDSPWSIIDETVIPVAYVYWNNALADGQCYFELHSDQRSLGWHKEHHFDVGGVVRSGFDIGGYTLNTDSDAGVTFSVASGVIADEDIGLTTTALPDGGLYWHWYRATTTGEWRWVSSTFPFPAGTYPQYNYDAGGATGWTLADIGGLALGEYVNLWVFTSTGLTTAGQVMCVPGQNKFTTLAAAQAESLASVAWGTLPVQEIAPVWKVTYRARSIYGGTYKTRIEAVQRVIGTGTSVIVTGTPTNAGAITSIATPPLTSTNVQSSIDEIGAWLLRNALANCGDGSDGAVVLGGAAAAGCSLAGSTYTMIRNIQATDITLNNGYTLSCDGFIVYHTGTFTWNGLVTALAKNGGTPTAGAVSWTGSSRPLFAGGVGTVGKSGGAGNGTNAANALPSLAGNGGSGGTAPPAYTGGNGGVSSVSAAYSSPTTAPLAYDMLIFGAAVSPTFLRGAAGGGGGAADATGTGGGGGGGCGNGLVKGYSVILDATATLAMIGGRGGNAGAVGNAGSGGGGGGGHFRICCHSLSGTPFTAAVSCAGGAPGTNTGTGGVGTSGSMGTFDIIYF